MPDRQPITEDQKYVHLSLPADLMREVDELIQNGTRGYQSRAEVAKDALRRLLDELEASEERPPRLEHMNVFEDHVILRDNDLRRTVFVYQRNGDLACDLCESSDCIHTRYADTLSLRR
jgi:Arc/MetJ-type ribon-helix-helix transcriptional regulator